MPESDSSKPETHSPAGSSTAGNTDMEGLLQALAHLWSEHRAMRELLENPPEIEHLRLAWKADVARISRGEFGTKARQRVDEALGSLPVSNLSPLAIRSLTTVLNHMAIHTVLP